MSNVLKRATAMLAVLMASMVVVATASAQMPTSPWKKGAPFPEPDEELYGVAANGKLYVIGGWDDGKAGGVNYEYDPATDKWTQKQPMPRPAHHAALGAANGKIYTIGGATTMEGRVLDDSIGRLGDPKDPFFTAFGPARVLSVNEVYDPATNKWETRRPMSVPRNHAFSGAVNGKIY